MKEQEVLKHWVSPGRCNDQIYYLTFLNTQPTKDSLEWQRLFQKQCTLGTIQEVYICQSHLTYELVDSTLLWLAFLPSNESHLRGSLIGWRQSGSPTFALLFDFVLTCLHLKSPYPRLGYQRVREKARFLSLPLFLFFSLALREPASFRTSVGSKCKWLFSLPFLPKNQRCRVKTEGSFGESYTWSTKKREWGKNRLQSSMCNMIPFLYFYI